MKEALVGLDSQTMRTTEGFHRVEPDYKVITDISSELQTTIFGQEKAMDSLARAVLRSRAGFSDPRRPEMTAMFLGPTGVGKTEAGKALAKFLYPRDWEDRFLRIDCTQLMESHSVGRLKGSEPSYVGYGDSNILITPDFLDRGGIVMFDEIEKAHPNVLRWLLPVMEEGQQRALVPKPGGGMGKPSELAVLDFTNSYVIMTANVGAEALHKARAGNQGIGFHSQTDRPDMEKIGTSELKKSFKDMPEFLGRIDATVVFKDLERPQFEQIFNKFLEEINRDQRGGQNYLAVTSELRNFVIDHAETGEYGAREIRHKLNTFVIDKAAEIKFSRVLPEDAPLIGDLEGEEVIFWTTDVKEKAPEPKLEVSHQIETPKIQDRDPGSYIGYQPEDEITPPKHVKPLGKFKPHVVKDKEDIDIPPESVSTIYDVLVTNEDGSTSRIQGVDKLIGDLWLENFGTDPKYKGKVIASAKLVPHKPKEISFFMPPSLPTNTIDLAITVHTPLGDQMNMIKNLPLLEG